MKAPGDFRPTWRNGVIQIHITRACDLSCVGCTQGSNLSGKPVLMDVKQFERACLSLKDYFGVIGIFGGNPVLHPEFEPICRVFESIIPYEQRGLWSNNLRNHGKLCRSIFNPEVSNLNVHGDLTIYEKMKRDWPECNPIGIQDSRHSPPYVALKDMENITDEERWKLIETCDINQYWSAMVCVFRGGLRAFFCELAGAQSMLHENEPDYPDSGLKVVEGWWRLPINFFQNQINKHCFECGIPLRGFGDLSQGNVEYVSKTHLPIYQLKKSNGKVIKLINNTSQLGKTLNRATDYIQNGQIMERRILIAVPTKGFCVNDQFYDFYNQIEKPDGTACTFSHGQSPARNRNLMIEQAIELNCSHILFLDDDTAPPPNILTRLLTHDKDIVTALYLMRNFPHQPIIFDYSNNKGECMWHLITPNEQGLIPIINCGLGCVLIKIEVFKKMEKPWIRLGQLEKDCWCDDIDFFIRARECGFQLFCDLSLTVGHFQSMIIRPEFVNDQWHISYDSNGTSRVILQMPVLEKKEKVA